MALTRLLASNHSYAVETLRHVRGGEVPREERWCRFCGTDVETPEHVLLRCKSDHYVLGLRADYLRTLLQEISEDDRKALWHREPDPTEQLKYLLFSLDAQLGLTAKFVFQVQKYLVSM